MVGWGDRYPGRGIGIDTLGEGEGGMGTLGEGWSGRRMSDTHLISP